MDKYEKKVRVNQIVSCIRKGEYQDAQEIADTIDWRQERSIRTLRMVSEVYKINRRYDDSLAVLNLAYEKNPEDPIKRKIIYDLCELAIKMGQFGIAVRYMKEFSKMAPRDPGRYILQYRLLKATDADPSERIELLEEFKSRHFGDFDGKWAYELAYLYHWTGKSDKCVECCNEIALWFVTGPIVVKALKLKKQHEELTYEEEQKIAASDEGVTDEEVLYQKRHQTETGPVYMDTTPEIGDGYSTTDIEDRVHAQQEIRQQMAYQGYQQTQMQRMHGQGYPAQNINQSLDMTGQPQGLNIEVKKVDASTEPTIRMAEKKTGPSIMSRETTILPNINKTIPDKELAPVTAEAEADNIPQVGMSELQVQQSADIQSRLLQDEASETQADPEIPAGPAIPGVVDDITQTGTIAQQEISVNLDKFSTMNLQAELRENMEKLQEATGEPLREKEEKLPERTAEPDKDLTELKPKSDTRPIVTEAQQTSEQKQEPVAAPVQTVQQDKPQETASKPEAVNQHAEQLSAPIDPTQPPAMTAEEIAAKITSVPVPEQFKNMISQELDGQMQLNVPDEEPMPDKQITGQMDIESILAEWDKLQDEARERRIKAAKKKSLEQTNELAKKLKEVIPELELPKPEDEKEEPEAAVPEIQPASFTAPLVVPENETGEVSVADIEAALEAEAEPETENEASQNEEPEYKESEPEGDEKGTEDDDYGHHKWRRRKHEKQAPKAPAAGEEEIAETSRPEAPMEESKDKQTEPSKRNPNFVTYETVELPSVFDSFRNIKGLPQQLKEAEGRMSMEAPHGNVLIMGSEHAARMELVQAIVRDMSERDQKKGEIKAATIDADTFNNKDVTKSIRALAGNILVIEGAGRLSDDAMNSLISVLSGGENDILVILEDSRGGAKNLNEYSGFGEVFDVVIDIPTLSNDYLVDHAKSYAKDKEYTLDDMAVLALYQRIDERQTADHVVTSDEVEHIIDAAIKKANKKNLKHLGDVLLGKRYNDDDLIVLREKDFAK